MLHFLSRLCGGEDDIRQGHTALVFLSRLCGGEFSPLDIAAQGFFLSRLCGGEFINIGMSTFAGGGVKDKEAIRAITGK